MSSSLIRGKYIICRAGDDAETTTVISDGAVLQRDGVIVDLGPYEQFRTSTDVDEVLGGPNYVVFPGLVNTHHHGRGVTTFQMDGCDTSLETFILAAWGRRPWDHYLMTLYTAIQMIESGKTGIMYNHSQTPVYGLEEDVGEILRAFRDMGMRTAFSVFFREQNRVVYTGDEEFMSGLPSDLAAGVREYLSAMDLSVSDYFKLFEQTYDKCGSDPNGLVTVLLSPANVQWVSDDFLQKTKEYAAKYQTGDRCTHTLGGEFLPERVWTTKVVQDPSGALAGPGIPRSRVVLRPWCVVDGRRHRPIGAKQHHHMPQRQLQFAVEKRCGTSERNARQGGECVPGDR